MRDMVLATETIGAPRIGTLKVSTVIGSLGFVCGVISIGELIILGFGNPPRGDAKPAPEPDPLTLEAAHQVLVKELVVTELVSGDISADFLQDRFPRGVAQCCVIRARGDLHHAARNHFAGTGAPA